MIKRREFIAGLGSAAAWPLGARAQQRGMPTIGYIRSPPIVLTERNAVRFRQGLGEEGYVEGRNVAIEYRLADGHYDRIPTLVADLVRRQVALIVADAPSTFAAKAATATIPIIFVVAIDPVKAGRVARLNRPGGNLSGATSMGVEVGAKRLELMHELIPNATDIGLLVNPAGPNAESFSKDLLEAARILGLQIHILQAANEAEIDSAFEALSHMRVGGLVIGGDPLFNNQSQRLADLALRHKLPSIYQYRQFTSVGGLMSYGVSSFEETFHIAGLYAGRILKGEKPSDLPVQQATRIELVLNLKTANLLGLTF